MCTSPEAALPPPAILRNCLNASALPRQALTVEPTGHEAAAFCESRFLYIATCTHFRLCRFLKSMWCVRTLQTSGDVVFQTPRICDKQLRYPPFSLLPHFMRACVCVWECVPIVWPECSVTLVNKKENGWSKDACVKDKVWKQSNQTFVQETHFVTYL